MPNLMINARFKFAVGPAMTMLLLTGCMVGPKYHAPSPSATATAPPASYKESPTQFQDTDGWKVAQPQDAMLHGKWWEVYNDPELNALEDRRLPCVSCTEPHDHELECRLIGQHVDSEQVKHLL